MTGAFFISLALLSSPVVTDTLQESRVTALKEGIPTARLASSVTVLGASVIQKTGTYRPGQLSAMVPGLYIPDYGASLTSTIYLRGLGSRMENPVMGLYVDGIPVLDKNAYDFDWEAVQGATLLRGPQGTLYGRNAMGGVLSLRTLSPSDEARPSALLEYGTANTVRAAGFFMAGNHAFSASFRHTDGFFRNTFSGTLCDPYNGLSLRWKWEKGKYSNILSASLSSEGGFAYGQVVDGVPMPVNYNDEAGYRRLSVIEGFRMKQELPLFELEGTASLQLLADDMRMDQDYTARPVFTLQQTQLSGAATAEVLARRKEKDAIWQPVTGFFTFYKLNRQKAPVHFKRVGIQELILDNANKNIPSDIGYLAIPDEQMPIYSGFLTGSWNAALFHQSVFRLGRWTLTAGLRLDYEGASMDYDCLAQLHYQFVPTMKAAKAFEVPYRGNVTHHYFQVLPKVSALFEATDRLRFFGTVSKGYRAGGFNTQIFSDILQYQTMTALMKDLGVYLDKPMVSVVAGNTEYNPEKAWNFEVGARYGKGNFRADAALYWIEVRDQQLTVFPEGMTTGRMMTNAGRSRSLGAEGQLLWQPGNWRLQASYAYCHASMEGKALLPYVPAHTVFALAGYHFPIGKTVLSADASLRGAGPFCWNEENTLREPFTLQADARIGLSYSHIELYVRGRHLTGTATHTFYFKSLGNEFLAQGKPRQLIIGLTYKF